MKSIFDDDELLKYDSPPDDDPEDDDIDWLEEEREAIKEQELEKQKKMQANNFSQGVFQGVSSSPWGQQAPSTGQYSPWGTSQQQYSPWGNNVQQQSTPGFGMAKPAWGGTSPWNQQTATAPGTQQQQYVIDRRKKVIFTDLQDCLISSISGGGQIGVPPRGISDIYIRQDVIGKIRCFGPDWVYILTNQNVQRGTEEEVRVTRLIDFVSAAVSDILRLPLGNVRCIMKAGIDPYDPYTKPGTGLLKVAFEQLGAYGVTKADTIVLGSRSGFQGQSGQDAQMAEAYGLDYIDIQQLVSLYK